MACKMEEKGQYLLIRILLGLSTCLFLANFVFGLYIVLRMMVPERVKYRSLWIFYTAAISACLLAASVNLFLMVYPDRIYLCFASERTWVSTVHSAICSLFMLSAFL